ncbi:protein kilB [Streptomyces sp. NPDC094049]|uniref:protein kilB n=1 Tax=Streptomyces sp. NPDC094049 TaxID=3154987 RepID=UPI00331E71DC
MLATVLAIAGTLLGAIVTGWLQHISQRSNRRATDAAALRAEGLAALTDLVTALADHRRAMWVREDLRLRGEDWTEARTESHRTRSAITTPLLRVQLLLPALAPSARKATQTTYTLRGVAALDVLDVARANAITATDELVTAAGRAFAAA